MSLQVWLPLNGDLQNQGLQLLPNLSYNTFTIQNDGKIGKCYSGQGIYHLSQDFLNNKWSLCTWVKSSQWSQYNDILLCKNTSSSDNCQFYFSIINGHILKLGINGGSSSVSFNYTFAIDTWYHVAATFDGSKYALYINGELKKTGIISNVLKTGMNNLGINCRSLNNNGTEQTGASEKKLNDVRIYDHALSDKEVEEIAKGLVLHYKLDDAYIEPTTILSSEITTTAYNASLNKYGYNTDSNLGKVEGVFQGKSCVKVYTLTAGQRAQPYSYFSNLYTSNGTNSPAYKALSFDYFTTVPTTTWLNFYKLGSGTGTATWRTINTDGIFTGVYTNSSNSIKVKPNEWNHIEIVFNGTSNADAQWGYCINGPAHTSDTNYYFLYANIQLEENDHVTGYGNQIMHNSICYDSSGYNNDGTVIGSIDSITNSPVYNMAISMNNTGTSNHIESTKNIDISSDAITVSCWVKATSKATNQVFFTMSNIQFGTLNSLGYVNPTNMAGFTLNNFINNEWNHIVVIKNGSTYQLYINGIAETQNGANNYYVHNSSKLWLLNRSYNNNYAANASIVDLRVYATILSINDIKELYNTSTTIDNKGNIYARELVEI